MLAIDEAIPPHMPWALAVDFDFFRPKGADTALYALGLITIGLFDRFAKLKLVLGHLGEALPFWLYRLDYMHRATVTAGRCGQEKVFPDKRRAIVQTCLNRRAAREQGMLDIKLLIGGKDAEARGRATFERRNPLSGEVATRAAAATPADAVAAADAAATAFPAWAVLAPNARRKLLQAAAAKLRAATGEFAARVSAETGSTLGWGHFNVHFAAMLLEEAAAMTTQITGELIPSDHAGTMAMAIRQPAGVVLGMAPWNAPVILGVRAIAMPLACGNTVILKASEICPATHRLIGDVFAEAEFPPGVVNVVTHSAEAAPAIAEALIGHRAVRRVNFTGSTRVGRLIAEMAGRNLKPVLLELGGKAPLVVLDDADLGEAVAAANFGAFMHQGQICMSTERVIVDQKVGDDFVGRFKARAETLTLGDPKDGQFALAGLVDKSSVTRLNGLIADAKDKGAKIVTGGQTNGLLFPPTILDHVTRDMRIYSEESFGPVVAVIRAQGTDDAVALANDSDYGLSAAVFGRDVGRALAVARRIESGICHINSATVQDEGQMPFGGTKASGYGRFGGKAAIAEFTELRWITLASEHRHYPI
jgi:acyl-CoA reductase-like NAD-dependent aldehyde dehydrogenase